MSREKFTYPINVLCASCGCSIKGLRLEGNRIVGGPRNPSYIKGKRIDGKFYHSWSCQPIKKDG